MPRIVNYTCTKLESAQNQTRLLTIRPGNRLQDIQCSLEISSLDSRPGYEALSYVWGDETIRVPITVDGKRLDVTENLSAALRRLRDRKGGRVMWVDAICINQEDSDEKSVQVAMMRRIYSGCTRAILWLGEYAGCVAPRPTAPRPRPLSLPSRASEGATPPARAAAEVQGGQAGVQAAPDVRR